MSGLLFLALLMVVVSGLIAYIGDLIGRKMGRKRLTLFGLRPRYTAIVISVAAGMIIALCTIAAALILSKDIRDSFIKPRAVLQKEIDQLRIQLAGEKSNLVEAKAQSEQAKTEAQQAQQELSSVKVELGKGKQQLATAKIEFTGVQKKLQVSKSDLEKSKKQVKDTEQELIEYGKQLDNANRKLKGLNDEQVKLQQLIKAMDPFLQSNFSPLAFAKDQEILSGLIPTKGSPDARRIRLRGFLDTAERIVRQQSGLKPTVENPFVFLQVDNNGKITKKMTEDEAVERLSNRLAGVSGASNAVVRLVPANNVPVGGQAFIDIDAVQIVPNTQVFNAREEVARLDLTVTSQTTSGDILTLLVDDLLRKKVPDALRKQQMPLILRRFDPANPTGMPGASPSLLSWDDLAAAMEKARKLNGRVSIIARSSKAVNRFDPLDLTLEVVGSD